MKISLVLGSVEIVNLPYQRFSEGVGRPTRWIKRDYYGRVVSDEIHPPYVFLQDYIEEPQETKSLN